MSNIEGYFYGYDIHMTAHPLIKGRDYSVPLLGKEGLWGGFYTVNFNIEEVN